MTYFGQQDMTYFGQQDRTYFLSVTYNRFIVERAGFDPHAEETGEVLETDQSDDRGYLLPSHALVVDVECEYRHARGEGDDEDGHPVIDSCRQFACEKVTGGEGMTLT